MENTRYDKINYDNGQPAYDGMGYDGADGFIPHGTGASFYEDGTPRYKGGFVNGMWEGKGQFFSETGVLRYEGDFSNGLAHGEGKQFYPNGTVQYKGCFANDQWEGRGRLFDRTGALVCSGSFQAGILAEADSCCPLWAEYCCEDAFQIIRDTLSNGRANTLKEALDLYENTMHQRRMEAEQSRQTELFGQLLAQQSQTIELLGSFQQRQSQTNKLLLRQTRLFEELLQQTQQTNELLQQQMDELLTDEPLQQQTDELLTGEPLQQQTDELLTDEPLQQQTELLEQLLEAQTRIADVLNDVLYQFDGSGQTAIGVCQIGPWYVAAHEESFWETILRSKP